ncbi:purine catabolism regulatory protein [Enterococcus florum]|uniref:Purine catabolism regulatory protein n=1 Tax=Enterococcus florum TaxID=2480627 RepID=A0A4P5PID0_9ENTE|nr:PucR family transcriptional regulator [Enterococcus florum]GCF95412.1 purine catabolism regulatory protein [Enterococcus florum]
MGVKLNELLTLPSLREAEVIAGKNNLNSTVTSLSFLEVSDMSFFAQNIQIKEEYYAGELVISSFFSIREDVEKQCEAIRHLHELGEIGMLLYYVGIVIPELDPRVVQTAEDLDFVIVLMPKHNFQLRYNEAIVEIMTEILKQKSSEHLVNEVLEKTSLLPEHLRSVEMTLKILADLLRTNIVLTNANGEIVNQIKWPRNSSMDISEFIRTHPIEDGEQLQKAEFSYFYKEIYHKDNGFLHFYLIKEHDVLTQAECEQSIELIQVSLNLWGKNHGEISEYALVQAILNDESEKMYRLANSLSIDVKAIDRMWLLQLKDTETEKLIKSELIEHAAKYYQTCVVQIIDNQLVALLGNYRHNDSELNLTQDFVQSATAQEQIESIVLCPRMRNTTDVRKTYQLVNEVSAKLKRIYKERKTFSISELRQVDYAVKLVQSGETEIEETLAVLEPILQNQEYLTTLCCFLLDAQGDFQRCSELLFVHKNTVKYRIKKISELLGYTITRFSESYECYFACMIYRLIHK